MDNREIILDVKKLNTTFVSDRKKVRIVKDVSFQVKRGKTLAVVGESGCGKSVTMNSIMRFLGKNAIVDAENIQYNALKNGQVKEYHLESVRDPNGPDIRALRGPDMAMVFQDPMSSLNPVYKVGDQVAEGLLQHNKGMTKKEAREKVLEMFKKLICDEPTTALDVTIQAQIMELLKDLQVNDGKSIILITHNMGLVAEMADEVCVMYMGRVVEFGSLEDVFDRTSHPYTKALLRSVPVLGLADGQKLETIPGATPNPSDLKGGCEFADRCPECIELCRRGEIPCYEVGPGHHVRCLKYSSCPEVE